MWEHLLTLQRRLQARLLVLQWCKREAALMRRWSQQRKLLVRQEDRQRPRLRQQPQRSRTRIQGIVATMTVTQHRRVRVVGVEGLWCKMRRALERPRLHREARRETLVRRLVSKHCEAVRVRWTQRRRRVWLQVLLW